MSPLFGLIHCDTAGTLPGSVSCRQGLSSSKVRNTGCSLPGPYYRADNWGSGETTLQRAKWRHYRGEILEGFDVHHRDGDKTNNRLLQPRIVRTSRCISACILQAAY